MLFERGSAESYRENEIKKLVLLEKWQATMELIAGGRTKDNIRKRAIVGEAITGTRSKTKFERQPLELLMCAVNVPLRLEKRLQLDSPATDQELKACCGMAGDDINS